MRTVIFAGNSRIDVKDLPIPEPGPGEVLIKVDASAICGSEMKTFRSAEGHPTNTGHEFVGTVVANPEGVGPHVGARIAANIITGCGECEYCRAGDRRFCDQQGYLRTGHAEYVAMPAVCCMPLPDELPFDEGVLLGGDTLGVANHALAKTGLHPGDTVAVVGCGPVGLGFVSLLCFKGVRTIAVEMSPYRRDLAARAGAAEVIDPASTDAAWKFAGSRVVKASTLASMPAVQTPASIWRSMRCEKKVALSSLGRATRRPSIRGSSSWRKRSPHMASGTSSIGTTTRSSISTGRGFASAR